MKPNDQDISEKGKHGELTFNEWLKKNGLSFLYLNQDKTTFSPLFKDNLKRPDFLILLESIGLIAVDVKNYSRSGNNPFTLKLEKELRHVMTFERLFRIPVWYVYLSEQNNSTQWYWISALKAIEVGEMRMNSKTSEQFISIELNHFENISTSADLGRLYTHRLSNLGKIKRWK